MGTDERRCGEQLAEAETGKSWSGYRMWEKNVYFSKKKNKVTLIKQLVSLIASTPLLCPWAYLEISVIIMAYRLHSWVSLLMTLIKIQEQKCLKNTNTEIVTFHNFSRTLLSFRFIEPIYRGLLQLTEHCTLTLVCHGLVSTMACSYVMWPGVYISEINIWRYLYEW